MVWRGEARRGVATHPVLPLIERSASSISLIAALPQALSLSLIAALPWLYQKTFLCEYFVNFLCDLLWIFLWVVNGWVMGL
uniref:Uncharacterized protein n=1 Tax=Fagus sylvatica TaxID=28930 RepID=A0A2N9FAI3_FAGSY